MSVRRSADVPASAEVARLQTAAGLENLLVLTYVAVLGLPVVAAGPTRLRALAVSARGHHAEHATSFNATAVAAGGVAQTEPDATWLEIVRAAEPTLTTIPAVTRLIARVEQVAASTYVRDAGLAATGALRSLYVAVAGVEAQHAAALLLAGLDVGLETGSGPDLSTVPAAAVAAGIPVAFYPAGTTRDPTAGTAR